MTLARRLVQLEQEVWAVKEMAAIAEPLAG